MRFAPSQMGRGADVDGIPCSDIFKYFGCRHTVTFFKRLAVKMPRARTGPTVMRREKLTPAQIWQRKFKMRGYNVLPATLNAILDHLSLNQSTDEGRIVDLIITEAKKKSVKSAVITREIVDPILAGISSDGSETPVAAIKIIDAFDVPKNMYDPLRKQWSRSTRPLSLHAEAASKAALYRERLQLLVQRMLRRVGFSKPRLDFGDDVSVYDEIVPVQSLPGREGTQIVMGAISQLEDGKFFLEDMTGAIELDLSETTENSIVMCDGYYGSDSVYHALHLGNPPVETREQSMLYSGGVDFFGAGKAATEEQRQLQREEAAALDDRIVFFSDVWVDDVSTMEKLRKALGGYEEQEAVPTLFVLCGNFSAKILRVYDDLRNAFKRLGELIASHQRLCEKSLFVFLPGPNDPGPANILPRPPLPPMFRKAISEHLPQAIFSSSPCRQDLLRQMGRACVLPPSTYEDALPHQHLSIGILEQSHLCPLPLSVQPILWDFDHSLRIWPTPDLVVLADCCEQYIVKHQEAICINPGSFAIDGTFTTYLPASREPENCSL